MDQNCFSMADLGILLGLIGIPTGILFRQLIVTLTNWIAALTQENGDLKALLDRSLGVNEGQTEVSKEVLKTARPPRR